MKTRWFPKSTAASCRLWRGKLCIGKLQNNPARDENAHGGQKWPLFFIPRTPQTLSEAFKNSTEKTP